MLPKTERFTKKDFVGVRPQVIFRGTYMDVSLVRNGVQKFGCVISKKRIKRAVDRNRAKRKVYTALNTLRPNISQSLIFYPKQTLITSKHPLLIEELQKVFATL
jgi:ribonuclease P protein component